MQPSPATYLIPLARIAQASFFSRAVGLKSVKKKLELDGSYILARHLHLGVRMTKNSKGRIILKSRSAYTCVVSSTLDARLNSMCTSPISCADFPPLKSALVVGVISHHHQ
jgi:hypothetical protein